MRRNFDRDFQLWEYVVSHGGLLVRSPRGPDVATNVDLVFAGVEYIGAPRHLPRLVLDAATPDEISACAARCGARFAHGRERVRVLESDGVRHCVAALALTVAEHADDIFSTPFEFGPVRALPSVP